MTTQSSNLYEAQIDQKEEAIYVASYWTLMWWRFRKHKMALVSAVILFFLYLVAIFCEFTAPYDPEQFFVKYKFAPPSNINFFDQEGNFQRPFVYQTIRERDPQTLESVYVENKDRRYPICFLVRSGTYKFWNLWETDLHLFGLGLPFEEGQAACTGGIEQEEQGVFLFGADRLGRDVFSRVIYGSRVSLSIGLVGVFISMVLGILIGGASGFYGGAVDNLVQRSIEFIRSIPSIPLWMGLSAALPPDWPVIRVYFGITVILAFLNWTGLARVVRGRFLSLREEDFVMAARLMGTNEFRIIVRHMVPSFLSYIIAWLSLAVPGIILAETGLSFLGLGLRAPAISWGVLLQEAQNLTSIVLAPWVFTPGGAVILAVLAFNFLGDGLRDAADPYAR